jgi:hypothetical protein
VRNKCSFSEISKGLVLYLTPSPFTQFSDWLEPMLALGEARTEATHGL